MCVPHMVNKAVRTYAEPEDQAGLLLERQHLEEVRVEAHVAIVEVSALQTRVRVEDPVKQPADEG